jgi:hypothetical protein
MKLRLLALLLALMMLCACGSEGDGTEHTDPAQTTATTAPKTEPEEGGTPSEVYRYSDLPENYTVAQALADGCMVMEWRNGATTPKVWGIDYWETFLEVSGRGENITLRVVYFNDQRAWFTDFYYSRDRYTLYTRDIYSEYQIGPYAYLKKIEGADIYSGEDIDCYILTNDAQLGAESVLSMMHICDIEAERDVAFTIVDFTTYFG